MEASSDAYAGRHINPGANGKFEKRDSFRDLEDLLSLYSKYQGVEPCRENL
jgi:hypothetical protein